LLSDARGTEGSESGLLLLVNTAGAIAATFLLPFLVIPLIGSPATLALLAVINALIGAALLYSRPSGARKRGPVGAVGLGVAAVALITLVTGTAFRNPTVHLIESRGGAVYQTAEDEIAAVQAGTLSGTPQLWVGGTSMTLLTVDTKFMPLLPIMLRPDTDRGLVIAFGMGTAYRTALAAKVRTDVVELVPSVITMFPWFYPDARDVLANANGRVIVSDGRNHVALTTETYDFVIVDPPPPIESSGVSVISSLEFYQAAKARLNPDGVMMQWVPYGQTLDEFLAHVRTFLSVFPNVRIIAGPGGYGFYMLGSDGAVDLAPAAVREVLLRPGILDDVNDAPDAHGLSADEWAAKFQGLYVDQGDHLRAAVRDGPLVTDDRPLPEYFFLRHLREPNAVTLSLASLRSYLGTH
jgi:spermidine synthase